jgi:hypothetical protein
MRPRIMFLLWRVWHRMNNIVHVDGKASIAASIPYLCNYLDSFSMTTSAIRSKGKNPLIHAHVDSSEGLASPVG